MFSVWGTRRPAQSRPAGEDAHFAVGGDQFDRVSRVGFPCGPLDGDCDVERGRASIARASVEHRTGGPAGDGDTAGDWICGVPAVAGPVATTGAWKTDTGMV